MADDTAPARWDMGKACELRRMAEIVMTDHGHAWTFHASISRETIIDEFGDSDHVDEWIMTRDNCGACALMGWGESAEGDPLAPNYAGWARLYVEAGRAIPARYREAFAAECASDNRSYVAALGRSIATFGVRFI